jgi:anaphase-promoting complex subunit 7
LEIPYILRSLGKGSRKRPDFEARHGKVQVPFLEDPNTGRSMFESRDIVNYLVDTYG